MKNAALARVTRKATARRVPVEVRLDNARDVSISGDFNGWSDVGVRLSHDGSGLWRTVLHLPPGEYQYRLIVDGGWRDDPEAHRRVPNPFGTENCVMIVT